MKITTTIFTFMNSNFMKAEVELKILSADAKAK
jgi:hypothetical protein